MSNMKDTVNSLIDTIEDFLKIDQEAIDWETKPSADKWSKKEVVGHLIDSAQINLQRFVRCTYEEAFKLKYAQNEWVAAQHYQHTDVKEILDLWILINRQIIRVLGNYPPDRLQASYDGDSSHTVEWVAADYVRHLKHHLSQVN
jgi:hypothetical protein